MKNSNETKQRLIDATRQMIDAKGVDKVSLRELGKELDLSRSAVYVYFKNKEDLLAAVVIEDFKTLRDELQKLVENSDAPRTLIREMLLYFYDFGINNPEHYKLMFLKQWESTQHDLLHQEAAELFKIFFSFFDDLKASKLLSSSKQLSAITSSFILGLVEMNSAGHLEPEKGLDDHEKVIDSFVQLIFQSKIN